jgi:hypothetical protein
MTRKFLAFDIETATDVPGDDFNWKPHWPLGISCAATVSTESSEGGHAGPPLPYNLFYVLFVVKSLLLPILQTTGPRWINPTEALD